MVGDGKGSGWGPGALKMLICTPHVDPIYSPSTPLKIPRAAGAGRRSPPHGSTEKSIKVKTKSFLAFNEIKFWVSGEIDVLNSTQTLMPELREISFQIPECKKKKNLYIVYVFKVYQASCPIYFEERKRCNKKYAIPPLVTMLDNFK